MGFNTVFIIAGGTFSDDVASQKGANEANLRAVQQIIFIKANNVSFWLIPGDDSAVSSFWPKRSRAQSHRCTTAVLRHTKSLNNHFALLPRSHRGPVSVLAGYSALFISAPGSYLLSPGSQMKCFFLPKREDQIACLAFYVFSVHWCTSQAFLLHPSHKAASPRLSLFATRGEILFVFSFMVV